MKCRSGPWIQSVRRTERERERERETESFRRSAGKGCGRCSLALALVVADPSERDLLFCCKFLEASFGMSKSILDPIVIMHDPSAQEEDWQSIGENNLYPNCITSLKLYGYPLAVSLKP